MKYAIIFLSIVAQNVFADNPKPMFKLVSETLAPCGVIIEHYSVGEQNEEKYRNSDDGTDQYWLSDDENRSDRALLFLYNRVADIVISPKGEYLIVNSHWVSDHSDIILYKRVDKIHYKTIDRDFGKQLWTFFMKENKLWDRYLLKNKLNKDAIEKDDAFEPFDHSYINAVAWSYDGSAFIVEMLGYDGAPKYTHEWFCIYDLKLHHPTLDMQTMNRNSVQLPKSIAK